MKLPRAMLIDMDDTILSAYGRADIAWDRVAEEFAFELAPLLPQQVARAITASGRAFWTTAEAAWRLKLAEARQEVVKGGFAALAVAGQPALPADLAIRLADRFTTFREEEMFVFPGAHDAIDALKARGVKLALVTNVPPVSSAPRSNALHSRTGLITSRSRASAVSANLTNGPISTPCRRSVSQQRTPG